MRRWLINLICRWFHLIPMDIAIEIKERAEAEARRKAIEESAARVDSLVQGLTGVGLGPVGQAQYEAYQWCAQVIRAPKFKTPLEVQSEAYQKILHK